jgi:hypothetical protein
LTEQVYDPEPRGMAEGATHLGVEAVESLLQDGGKVIGL